MAKLLIVDDDENVCGMLQEILQTKGYTVDTAHSIQDANQYIEMYGYDLLILDWQLGRDSGALFLKALRAKNFSTPVIMLTARKDEQSCVYGLEEAGADDYLTKPFSASELLARIKSLQRRPGRYMNEIVSVGQLQLNLLNKELNCAGQTLQLHKQEAAILELLMKHPDELFSADCILSRLWPSDSTVSLDNVRVQVSNLRGKLKQLGATDYVKTVHRLGYKLSIPTTPENACN